MTINMPFGSLSTLSEAVNGKFSDQRLIMMNDILNIPTEINSA